MNVGKGKYRNYGLSTVEVPAHLRIMTLFIGQVA